MGKKLAVDDQLGFVLACLQYAQDNGGKIDFNEVGGPLNLSAGAASKRLARLKTAANNSATDTAASQDVNTSDHGDDQEVEKSSKKAKGNTKGATAKTTKATEVVSSKKRKLDHADSGNHEAAV